MDMKKLKTAMKKLEKETGLDVGGAFGFVDNQFAGEPEHYLIVWSNLEVDFPEEFEGFKVVRRGVPVAL